MKKGMGWISDRTQDLIRQCYQCQGFLLRNANTEGPKQFGCPKHACHTKIQECVKGVSDGAVIFPVQG